MYKEENEDDIKKELEVLEKWVNKVELKKSQTIQKIAKHEILISRYYRMLKDFDTSILNYQLKKQEYLSKIQK